jgi:hypothetical protein
VKIGHSSQDHAVHLVTQAQRPKSEDIAYRQRRYLLMMGFRAVCFVIAVVLFVNHAGWLAGIPAVFAIFIPYVAVVFANGGREPNNVRGFLEYRANQLPPVDRPAGHSSDARGSTGTNGAGTEAPAAGASGGTGSSAHPPADHPERPSGPRPEMRL